jgi:protein-S-isoprenylcysteine O-methyltransferase Ste14
VDVTELRKKALTGLARLQVVLALLLFLPAWSLRFWEAWVYWVLFGTCVSSITIYFLRRDPGLVESRLEVGPGAEHEKSQKVIQALASIFVCALVVVPGIEHRFHPLLIPTPLVFAADALFVAGLAVAFLAAAENSHASSIVEVKAGQRVISTGPYSFVRHPMYAGAVLMFLATPVALGSLWSLACALPLCLTVGARLLGEERYLSTSLPGYGEYCAKVRYRLIPCVW